MAAIDAKRDALLSALRRLECCAVAFSGGVDSAVVAKAAALALGDAAVAVTGTSASLAAGELEDAENLAQLIPIRHMVVATDELASPDYLKNAPDRCYHCKTELYTQLERLLPGLIQYEVAHMPPALRAEVKARLEARGYRVFPGDGDSDDMAVVV